MVITSKSPNLPFIAKMFNILGAVTRQNGLFLHLDNPNLEKMALDRSSSIHLFTSRFSVYQQSHSTFLLDSLSPCLPHQLLSCIPALLLRDVFTSLDRSTPTHYSSNSFFVSENQNRAKMAVNTEGSPLHCAMLHSRFLVDIYLRKWSYRVSTTSIADYTV